MSDLFNIQTGQPLGIFADDDIKEFDMGVGVCTLANSPADLGQAMIDERIKGTSWGEIANKFGLPSPAAARSKFTKLTGITDYKIKGSALKDLWDKNMLDALKAPKPKKIKAALKEVDDALKPPSQVVQEMGQKSANLADNMLESYANIHGDYKVEEVWNKFILGGDGYLKISQSSGLSIADVDGIVWNGLVKKHNGDIWKAYLQKPGSEMGFNAVKTRYFGLRQKGFTSQNITDLSDIPYSVQKMIDGDTWKMPAPGVNTPVLKTSTTQSFQPSTTAHKAAPPQQVIYSDPVAQGTNFAYKNEKEWVDWNNEFGTDMTSKQFAAFKSYTGSGYGSINNALRSGRTNATADKLSSAMRPVPFNTKVTRWTSDMGQMFDPMTAGGTVWKDEAFLSTAVVPQGTLGQGRAFKLVIDIPAGTKGRYVDTFSSVQGEKELLLDKGINYMVTHVESHGSYGHQWTIHLRALV